MTSREPDRDPAVRIDRWLWAARLYKTRSLAAAAVRGGRVQLNGARVKPARAVAIGDRVRVNRDEWRKEIIVLGLSDRRGPAREAVLLYEETADSVARRALEAEGRKAQRAAAPAGRPDKRARRELRGLRRRAQDERDADG